MRSPSSPPAHTPASEVRPQEARTQPTAQSGTLTPAQAAPAAHAQPSPRTVEMAGDGPGKAGGESGQDFDVGPHTAPEAAQAFAQAARAVFGVEWIRPAARYLEVNTRTIERLAKAAHTDQPFPVHEAWLATLDHLLGSMQADVDAARAAIRSQAYGRTPVASTPPSRAPGPTIEPTPTPDPEAGRVGAPWTHPGR